MLTKKQNNSGKHDKNTEPIDAFRSVKCDAILIRNLIILRHSQQQYQYVLLSMKCLKLQYQLQRMLRVIAVTISFAYIIKYFISQ